MAFSHLPPSSSFSLQGSSPQGTPIGSPPSLTYSELSEDFEVAMDGSDHRQDANVMMQKVLGYLDQVVEHLRDKNENDAANAIAISTVSIVKAFNDATAPWDIEKFLMNPRPCKANVVISNAASRNCGLAVGSSWASVAAREVDGNNKWVKFRPSDGLKRNVSEEDMIPDADTTMDADMRVVWISSWGATRPLAEVTNVLSQGPIFSMVYSPENDAVCVIFQHASSAQALLEEESFHRSHRGISVFGGKCQIITGLPYTEDDDLRRMAPLINERRRLTFARSQLFAHGMTEGQFKRDIYAEVGEQNVELVWLFNTGNATVVFTSTAIARRVRDKFRQESRKNGHYRDVHVSFSHDPCEKPMNLITQIPAAPASANGTPVPGLSRSNSNSNSGRRSTLGSSSGLSRSGSVKRDRKADADGWQTVGKRR